MLQLLIPPQALVQSLGLGHLQLGAVMLSVPAQDEAMCHLDEPLSVKPSHKDCCDAIPQTSVLHTNGSS